MFISDAIADWFKYSLMFHDSQSASNFQRVNEMIIIIRIMNIHKTMDIHKQ